MLQVHANRMCTCISFFVSKTVKEIRAYFLSMIKIQLKRVDHKLSRRTIDAPSIWRFREASSGPEKSLVQHGLEKKANVVDSRKLRGYKLKKPNTIDLERDLQRPRLRRLMDRLWPNLRVFLAFSALSIAQKVENSAQSSARGKKVCSNSARPKSLSAHTGTF